MELKNKLAIVFGATGLLGKPLCNKLLDEKGMFVNAPTHAQLDVRNQAAVEKHIKNMKPDIIFNCFVSFGGIIANEEHPGSIFYDNLQGNINIIEAARKAKVKKFIQVSSQCVYGDEQPVPFREHEVWDYGLPTANNAPYGISKRVLHVMLEAYRNEFGFNGITLIPSNMYGPGDNFHPDATHVIPALIRRAVEGRENGRNWMDCWGNGKSTREFLYSEDCADALILAAEKYDKVEPVNIGTGVETSIKELATMISEIEYGGQPAFNNNGLDGQSRRVNDVSRAKSEFGFVAKTSLEEGLKKTIDYFLENRNNLRETAIYE